MVTISNQKFPKFIHWDLIFWLRAGNTVVKRERIKKEEFTKAQLAMVKDAQSKKTAVQISGISLFSFSTISIIVTKNTRI